MRPPLPDLPNQESLWGRLDDIDIFASDHAPHLPEENNQPWAKAPNGSPSLETSLPMFMDAIYSQALTWEQLLDKSFNRPNEIFNLEPDDIRQTYVVVDPIEEHIIGQDGYETKAQGSPYHGKKVHGKVKMVVFRGKVTYEDSKGIIGEPRGGFITHKK